MSTFIFKIAAESTLTMRDIIYNFSYSSGDRVDLSLIDANANSSGNQAFKFIAKAAYSGTAGELRFLNGDDFTTVSGDVDGDRESDFSFRFNEKIDVKADFFIL